MKKRKLLMKQKTYLKMLNKLVDNQKKNHKKKLKTKLNDLNELSLYFKFKIFFYKKRYNNKHLIKYLILFNNKNKMKTI